MSEPIKVQYCYAAGAHFFFSDDPRGKGLCVAHSDPEAAFNEVTRQLNVLLVKNVGVANPDCAPLATFAEFREWFLEEVNRPRRRGIVSVPSSFVDWQPANVAA